MDESSQSAMSVNTYYCICATFILATTYKLEALPKRASPVQDQSTILPLVTESATPASSLHNVIEDRKPIVIRREDGFEKRDLLRCSRCHLPVAYKLKDSRADLDVVYILPDGLVTTEKMKEGIAVADAAAAPP